LVFREEEKSVAGDSCWLHYVVHVDKTKVLCTFDYADSSEKDSSSLPSIKDCLAFYFKKEAVEWLCENCSDVPEQPSTIRSKGGGQMVKSIKGNTLVDRGQIEQSDRKGCLSEQIEPDNSAHQVGENQNKQNVHSDKKVVISKLPPVLIVRVLRFSDNLLKAKGHVKFEENLDVGPYVDPRYL
jgi:uncharacterized UBP type Zn finger protein